MTFHQMVLLCHLLWSKGLVSGQFEREMPEKNCISLAGLDQLPPQHPCLHVTPRTYLQGLSSGPGWYSKKTQSWKCFMILIWEVAGELYIFVKTHWILPLKGVHSYLCIRNSIKVMSNLLTVKITDFMEHFCNTVLFYDFLWRYYFTFRVEKSCLKNYAWKMHHIPDVI